jgi:hypothetical protein
MTSHICPGDSSPQMKASDTIINSQTDTEVTNYMFANVSSGYQLKGTHKLQIVAELMNYNQGKVPVNIAFDFEYIPGNPEGYLNAQSLMFSATPCDQVFFDVPGKQFSLKSNEWIVPADLTLINARGHQHDG